MHTMKTDKGTIFQYHSDYSGECVIFHKDEDIIIPCEDILQFVSEYIRQQKMMKIEQMSVEELLNATINAE